MALTLATVETAIEGLIANGQSFTIDGTTYTQASLKWLMDLREQLQSETGSAYGFSMRTLKPPGH